MFTKQGEKWAEPQIVALVELDLQKMRVRIVWAREAIRARMRELEHPRSDCGQLQGIGGRAG